MQKWINSSLIFCLFFLLFSCGKSAPDSKEKQVKLLLDWWPNPIHVPIYAGLAKGIFSKYNLSIDIIKMHETPETVSYLLSKQADVALYYAPNTIKAFEKTEKLRVIASYIDSPLNCFLFRANGKIQDPADFQRKRIGGYPDGLFDAYIGALRQGSGIKFSDVQKVQIDLLSALLLNNVDIITGVFWNVEGVMLNKKGVKTDYFPLSAFNVPDYKELIFITRNDYIEKDESFGKTFRSAIEESINFALQNPEEAFELYMQMNPNKDESTRYWEKESWRETMPYYAKDQNHTLSDWVQFHDWMEEKGLIEKPISLQNLLEYAS